WVRATFDTSEMGPAEGAFRFRLVQCSGDGARLRLYRSEAYPTDGRFVSDQKLGRKLLEKLGPYVHAMMSVSLNLHGELLDWETTDQLLADEATWWAEAARMAMEETGAELLYLHWHLPDHVGHRYVAWVDPTGNGYSPERAEKGWKALRRYYGAMDRFVGEFMERFDLDENVIAVVAEHGMPANKKAVALVNAFRDKGWLKLTPDGRDVLWEESKLFFEQNHLWINLKGREPTGVVPPEQYSELRARAQALMRDLTDPETGEHVFSFVLTREEAPVVGLFGANIGDLVFCYAGGYRWSGAHVLRMGEERVVFPCDGGNHGPMIPSYETDVATVYGLLMLAGPGVRQGVREHPSRKGCRKTPDVPPTLAWLLDVNPPAQNEGRILHEFLEGFARRQPERTLTPTDRSLARRPRPVRKKQLKGDVTDEDP
ncbi:MAG: alkaline phosphatase family protein, partial [Candidatus Brocadiaceae bacterium]